VLFALVVVGVIGAYVYTERELARADKLMQKVNKQFAIHTERLQKLQMMQLQKKKMITKAVVTAALLERVPRSFLLAQIANNLPSGVSLLEFDLETKVKKPASSVRKSSRYKARKAAKKHAKSGEKPLRREIRETYIKLVGIAPTDVQVAQFIRALGRSKLVKEINLVYSQQDKIDDEIVRKFSIEILLRPDAHVTEEELKLARSGSIEGM